MKECIIKARGLTKRYCMIGEEIRAVQGVDLDITQGDFIAIMGPSGSGKTSFLDMIGCLDRLSEGKLEVLGQDVSSVKEKDLVRIRRQNIGFVFQEFLLVPTLTVLENVALPQYFCGLKGDNKKVVEVLTKVGLKHRLHHLPKQLSGGERQRVSIARALGIHPQILLADEPTGNLDTKNSQEIVDLFNQLNKNDGLTIVMATHDETVGAQADKIIYFQDGQIVGKK